MKKKFELDKLGVQGYGVWFDVCFYFILFNNSF